MPLQVWNLLFIALSQIWQRATVVHFILVSVSVPVARQMSYSAFVLFLNVHSYTFN
jgi:hypothetical protein